MGFINPDLSGALHGDDLKPAIETILREINGSMATDNLADGAVTTTKIEDAAITNAKINDLSADKINAGTIDASVIDVTNLDADNINTGTINAIDIVGSSIKTATSGTRITINDSGSGTDNELCLYDSSDTLRLKIGTDSIFFWDSSGTAGGYLTASTVDSVSTITFESDIAIHDNGLLNFIDGASIASIYLDSGDINIVGADFYVSGDVGGLTKSFIIPHPLKDNHKLRYVCPEFPEVLAMCRGTGKVKLPDHFEAITVPNSRQIIQDKENGNWICTGIRKGYEDFDCEPKDTIT